MSSGNKKKFALLLGAAAVFSGGAHAQDMADSRNQPVTSADIVVQPEIVYRDRSEAIAPVLSYGTDYFQRFEPSTVGDALKRVPSVSFLSDVLESDGVRLRGLDPAYTQILINGEQVPGAGADSGAIGNGADQAFFVDRIPAELIERVEVVRSSSANRSGDAVAGGINIVLRDGYSLDGGYVRGGLQYYANDGAWRENIGGVWGGSVGEGHLLVGGNMQDRHNPKDKESFRYDDRGAPLNNTEVQTDVRDGTDYSANFAYETPLVGGEFSLDGMIVYTDRYQDEDSTEYEAGIRDHANLSVLNSNDVDIEQTSYSLNGGYKFDMLGGENRIRLGYAHFETDEDEFENEVEYLRDATTYPEADRFTRDLTHRLVEDNEYSVKLDHGRSFGAVDLAFGVDYQYKERDTFIGEGQFRISSLPGGTILPNASGAGVPGYNPNPTITAIDGGDSTIERERIDPYVMLSNNEGAFEWEVGVRYETTDITVTDNDTNDSSSQSYDFLLPSAHLTWNLSEQNRLLFSVARTVRNPSFSFLTPANFESLGDNELIGNPELQPETAWGVDLGFEHRIGRTGIVGVNVFYRDISDVIEIYNSGVLIDPAPVETYEYRIRNTGSGEVYGIEFDLSTPLTFVGLENTGVFLNYSWLDSAIDDEFGERRFNSQSDYVLNVGFIHDMPTLNSAFGVTYRQQGDANSRVVGEEVTTHYDGDLEMFVEHRFGERFTLRFTGSNLLDASKDEVFEKYALTESQAAQSIDDEFELESETAGPVFQIIGRMAF